MQTLSWHTASGSGFTFRVIPDRWRITPLSAIGSLDRGGRYNPPSAFSVLYTADSQLTALREVDALFVDEQGKLRGVPRNPDLVLTPECTLLRVLDLTAPDMHADLGTSREELVALSPSRFLANARGRLTPTQRLGLACFRTGHISALKVPSAAHSDGSCFAIFPESLIVGEYIAVHDENGILQDELSGRLPNPLG
ncbi:MAG: RES family NAD+ phosphorylase [Acidobacteriaceae bacterium]